MLRHIIKHRKKFGIIFSEKIRFLNRLGSAPATIIQFEYYKKKTYLAYLSANSDLLSFDCKIRKMSLQEKCGVLKLSLIYTRTSTAS